MIPEHVLIQGQLITRSGVYAELKRVFYPNVTASFCGNRTWI